MKENEKKKKKKLKPEKLFVKMYTFFQIKPKLGTNGMDNQLVSIF